MRPVAAPRTMGHSSRGPPASPTRGRAISRRSGPRCSGWGAEGRPAGNLGGRSMAHDHSTKEKETTRFIHKWMNHIKVAREQLGEIQGDPAKYDLVRALDAVSHVVTLLSEVQK